MKIETVKKKDGSFTEHIICNPKEDNCPLCEAPLASVGFSWNIFHGEASASCCGAPYQLKSYYVDEEKYGKEAAEFAKSLDAGDRIECCINGKYLEAYRQAFRELDTKKVKSEGVYERVSEILGE